MNLGTEIESLLQQHANIDTIKNKLIEDLKGYFTNEEIEADIREKLSKTGEYDIHFDGITIHCFNYGRHAPFFRAGISLWEKNKELAFAWYSHEYNFNGKILDDFFHAK